MGGSRGGGSAEAAAEAATEAVEVAVEEGGGRYAWSYGHVFLGAISASYAQVEMVRNSISYFFWLITSRDTVRGWRKSLFLCSYLLSEVHGIEFSIEIEIRTGENNDSLRSLVVSRNGSLPAL